MADSRTSKSIKNARVSLIFYVIQMFIGFWSRKVFYDYLGSEVLGLDTTASTMLGFLNLAELGVSSSIGYFLYRPMFDGNYEGVNRIVTLQGWIYRRVACVIIIAAVILMCFFPIIFADIQIPLWYAYATFSVMLFGALLGYFVNYKMCVLYADQKEYKATKVTLTANMGLKVLLILLLPHVSHPFLFYIGTNLVGTIFGTIWLKYLLAKEYPWLKKVSEEGRILLKQHPEVLKKTRQIFVHRISTVIILEIQPLIMFAFSSLTAIAYYGNYIATIGTAKNVIKTAFSSTQAGIGNLIASNDKPRIWRVFWELYDSRMCMATAALLVLGFVADPFISVWLSPDYLLGPVVLLLVVIQSWVAITRTTVDNYIAGFGMFQDTWAPLTEAAIYLGGAFVFGYFWGIAGVLMGGVLSNIIIICIWKPYFLFTKGLKEPAFRRYFLPVLKRLLLISVNVVVLCLLNEAVLNRIKLENFLEIGIYGLVLTVIIFPVFYVEFLMFSSGMRDFNKRMTGLILAKFHKK